MDSTIRQPLIGSPLAQTWTSRHDPMTGQEASQPPQVPACAEGSDGGTELSCSSHIQKLRVIGHR